MKRRELLVAMGLAPVVSGVMMRNAHGAQQQGKETDIFMVDLLFVQSAHKVTLADNVLTLEGISPSTIFFSDRP